MLHLLNSLVMPSADFIYIPRQVSENEAFRLFHAVGKWKSYIGYTNAARVAASVLQTRIPISHDKTIVKKGDVLLVLRLKYRVADANNKRNNDLGKKRSDYEWFFCEIKGKEEYKKGD